MQNIIQLATLELNEGASMEEWKKMSDKISSDLNYAKGFISRDSGVGEDGKVYCIVKWESQEDADLMQEKLQSDEFKGAMEAFAKIVNMATMTSETLKVV